MLDRVRAVFSDATRPRSRLTGDLPDSLRARLKRETPAAVLVPIVAHPDEATVLFTERTQHLKHHAGQISFPGGVVEPDDDGAIAAALRETEEEIGLPADQVEIIGSLDLYLTITGFVVTPVVGIVSPGFQIRPDPFEVANVLEVPLAHLLEPDNYRSFVRSFMGASVPVYEIHYQGHRIWGATAAMLRNLSDVVLLTKNSN